MLDYSELDDVIEIIKNFHGLDISGYSKASLKRRVTRIMDINKLDVVGLKSNLINQEGFIHYFIPEMTVNVTEMFRDPDFYSSVTTKLFPYLETYPDRKSVV